MFFIDLTQMQWFKYNHYYEHLVYIYEIFLFKALQRYGLSLYNSRQYRI